MINIRAQNCVIFIPTVSLNISNFPLKNSKISNIHEKRIIPKYQINPFMCVNIESIYSPEKSTKERIEYTIAKGKIGTSYGTGVNACV